MRIDASITIATDDPIELERISKGIVGAKRTREQEQAAVLYGGTSPESASERGDDTGLGQFAEARAAMQMRDQALVDRDFWRAQAAKNARRALRAEKRLRAVEKRKRR